MKQLKAPKKVESPESKWMMREPPATVFDGFCHRPYDARVDGWMTRIPSRSQYPALQQAEAINKMYDDVVDREIYIWELERDIENFLKSFPQFSYAFHSKR